MPFSVRIALFFFISTLSVTPVGARLIEPNLPTISYINYPSLDPIHPRTISAQLRVPTGITHKIPPVVIVHGSSGVDSRGKFYIESLNN